MSVLFLKKNGSSFDRISHFCNKFHNFGSRKTKLLKLCLNMTLLALPFYILWLTVAAVKERTRELRLPNLPSSAFYL